MARDPSNGRDGLRSASSCLCGACMDLRLALGTLVLLVTATVQCGPRVPRPPLTSQPASALIEVDYPPPPARVEVLPPRPGNAVWINGEWAWTGRRWSWKPGVWVIPPQGAAYARQVVVRRGDGKLFLAAGTWRDARGNELAAPIDAVAPSTSSTVVNLEGDPVPSAADVLRDGGAPLGMPTLDEADAASNLSR